MGKLWKCKQEGDRDKVELLARQLCMPREGATEKDRRCYRIVANLLVQRGIDTFDKAKDFFRPDLNKLHNPFLMEDMESAVERIMIAVDAGERILVYGDYDVDGTSAVALVYSYLSTFYDNIEFYIPDRYEEGYGVSFKGVDYAAESDVKLIICLDCGIKATEEIAYAVEKNIDFIVCDHHLPGKTLPKAYAILDPKLENSKYPYDELCGCGIGFKLVQALQKRREKPDNDIIQYLDLVAIAIAADVVPVTGENRILAYHGLKVINHKPRVGLEAILACANINHVEGSDSKYYFNKALTISDLSFLVGPRINAAGRMQSGRDAVRLLIANNKEKADRMATIINENNESRKAKDREATLQAEQALKEYDFNTQKSIVLCNENWHQGIIGIVASRVAEKMFKPTIILTKNDGILTGSARSVKNFDIYSAIEKCRNLLTHFGGHKFAAGLSLREENFELFKQQFELEVEKTISETDLTPEIEVDMVIQLSDISDKLLAILQQFEPFGPENNEPVFVSKEVYDANKVRYVGKNHLKFAAIPISEYVPPISCIGFSLGFYYDLLRNGNKIDICYVIEENRYQGFRELQLNIKDIRPSDENSEIN